MTYAGKIDISDLTNIVKPAYENFDDMGYDIDIAKNVLKNFIVKYCKTKTVNNPPNDITKYGLCKFGANGMRMVIKNTDNIIYLFDMLSGNVYVGEYKTCDYYYNNNVSFDVLLVIHQDTISPTYKEVKLLSLQK